MKTVLDSEQEYKNTVKYFTVPGDVLMDVLHILFNNGLTYEIKVVNRKENSILLYVPQEKQPTAFYRAIENIECILTTYNHYVTGIPADQSGADSVHLQ